MFIIRRNYCKNKITAFGVIRHFFLKENMYTCNNDEKILVILGL